MLHSSILAFKQKQQAKTHDPISRRDEEFEEAFKRVDKDNSGFITSNEVEELLYETFGYPALEDEIKMFMDEFDANNDGKVSLEEFKAALTRMRDSLGAKKDVGKEYKSYEKMRGDRFKHIRMDNNLDDNTVIYGWLHHASEFFKIIRWFSIKQCDRVK